MIEDHRNSSEQIMEDDSSAIHFDNEVDNFWLDILLNRPGHTQESDAFNFVCLNIMKVSNVKCGCKYYIILIINRKFILMFFQFIKRDLILQLDIEKFKNLLMSDNLAVTSEEVVFELTQRWLDFNNISPYDILDSLFEVIRLPLIDPEVR